jgi:hypothetical protein
MKNAAKILIVLVFAWGSGANAAVIFSNGGIGNNGFISDTDFPGFAADDFTLASGASVITGVQWTGLYAFSNSPTQPDNFTIQFFVDVAGAPAASPFLSLPIGNSGRTDTGMDTSFGSDIFGYSVNLAPIVLAPNTEFWLSIFNDTATDADDNWFWGMQDAVGNSFIRTTAADPWAAISNRHDFTLTGPTPVSEPSALALLVIGVMGLLRYRWKQML